MIRHLVENSPLNTAVQSIIGRVLIALYVTLPQIPPSLFSHDLSLHGQVYEAVQRICTDIGTGTTTTMSKSLGLLIGTSLQGSTPTVSTLVPRQIHPADIVHVHE